MTVYHVCHGQIATCGGYLQQSLKSPMLICWALGIWNPPQMRQLQWWSRAACSACWTVPESGWLRVTYGPFGKIGKPRGNLNWIEIKDFNPRFGVEGMGPDYGISKSWPPTIFQESGESKKNNALAKCVLNKLSTSWSARSRQWFLMLSFHQAYVFLGVTIVSGPGVSSHAAWGRAYSKKQHQINGAWAW